MSYLLDALRKSENSKHRGDVPTIHSSDPAMGLRESRRSIGPLVLLLLPAFLVLAWLGMKQFAEPEIGGRDVETSPVAEAVAAKPAAGLTEEDAVNRAKPASLAVADSVSSRPPTAVQRTPVELLDGPGLDAGTGIGESKDIPAEAGATTVEQSSYARREASRTVFGDVASDRSSLVSSPIAEPEPEPESGSGREPYEPPRPSHIGYWELPQSIRKELPEFRISVLVYAERPQDRFILMNGQRQVEGDSWQQGMVLEEIRRDGAVFSYRLYRFLVSR